VPVVLAGTSLIRSHKRAPEYRYEGSLHLPTYRSSLGYTCLVLVNGQTDLSYESDGLAQEERSNASTLQG
jgi:hypothetical protein